MSPYRLRVNGREAYTSGTLTALLINVLFYRIQYSLVISDDLLQGLPCPVLWYQWRIRRTDRHDPFANNTGRFCPSDTRALADWPPTQINKQWLKNGRRRATGLVVMGRSFEVACNSWLNAKRFEHLSITIHAYTTVVGDNLNEMHVLCPTWKRSEK